MGLETSHRALNLFFKSVDVSLLALKILHWVLINLVVLHYPLWALKLSFRDLNNSLEI